MSTLEFKRCTQCEERQRNNVGVVASLCDGCRHNMLVIAALKTQVEAFEKNRSELGRLSIPLR